MVRSYDTAAVLPVPSFSTPSTPLPRDHSSGQLHQTPPPMLSPAAEGITEIGFLYLHTIFIQQGRMETTWTVLRKFGYGEGLDLREDFLLPRFDVPYDCSVELSPLGNQFLTDIFESYDKVSLTIVTGSTLMIRIKMALCHSMSSTTCSQHHLVTHGLPRDSQIRR